MRLGVCGICGRMGISVLSVLLERGHALAAAFDSDSAPFFGRDAGELLRGETIHVPIASITAESVGACDGIIDFSSPAASLELIAFARENRKPLVVGTTGFSAAEKETIEGASRDIPILFSPNMSLGVNVLFKLAEIASRALTDDYDVELFEAHHRFKKDAPSGTARRLVEIVKENMRGLDGATEITGRSGITGERSNREIGVMAMRAGDIVGEHTLFFAAMGERIELTHRLTSRDPLARGAVRGMEYLAGRAAGLYTMYDVLGL